MLGLEELLQRRPGGALGRPAPARRDGPGDRPRAGRVPDGRAALEPRREAARRHARRARAAPRPARHHDRLRHARPGRGDDARHARRGHARREDPAGRHAADALPQARQPLRRGVHRLAVDEPRRGDGRGRPRRVRRLPHAAAAGSRRPPGVLVGDRDPRHPPAGLRGRAHGDPALADDRGRGRGRRGARLGDARALHDRRAAGRRGRGARGDRRPRARDAARHRPARALHRRGRRKARRRGRASGSRSRWTRRASTSSTRRRARRSTPAHSPTRLRDHGRSPTRISECDDLEVEMPRYGRNGGSAIPTEPHFGDVASNGHVSIRPEGRWSQAPLRRTNRLRDKRPEGWNKPRGAWAG